MSVAGGRGRSYGSILPVVWQWIKSTFGGFFDGEQVSEPQIAQIDPSV
jgi:hypothetical protein